MSPAPNFGQSFNRIPGAAEKYRGVVQRWLLAVGI